MANKLDLERVVVTGASGMIGRAITWGRKYARTELDVRELEQVEAALADSRASAVVHLAGIDIHQCETNPNLAIATNIAGTRNVALAAKKRKIPFLFLSSACIFNGPIGSRFSESDQPAPCNVYGWTKTTSELYLADVYPENSLIVRSSWVFGGHGSHHKKFVDIALENAKRGETIFANREQEGSPTYVADLVDSIQKLLRAPERGIFHVSNDGAATAWDIAEEVVRLTGTQSKIEPLQKNKDGKQNHQRSPSEALRSSRVKLRSWQAALKAYLCK